MELKGDYEENYKGFFVEKPVIHSEINAVMACWCYYNWLFCRSYINVNRLDPQAFFIEIVMDFALPIRNIVEKGAQPLKTYMNNEFSTAVFPCTNELEV